MDKAYSINDEEFTFMDPDAALQALADDGRLVVGGTYWEVDIVPAPAEEFISAERVLDQASDSIYDELGECAEDAFSVSVEAKQELHEVLKAWARKHVTGRYWRCVGKSREIKVTADDVATHAG